MLGYIVRRLLLIVPTLFGIMLVNFAIIQSAPAGPVAHGGRAAGQWPAGVRGGGGRAGARAAGGPPARMGPERAPTGERAVSTPPSSSSSRSSSDSTAPPPSASCT